MTRYHSRNFRLMGASLALAAAGALSIPAYAVDAHPPSGANVNHDHRPHHDEGRAPMGPMSLSMFGGKPGERLLKMVDASDAQRTQILQITRAAQQDLQAQRESARAWRDQGLAIFTAPQVDAAAAETLRQSMLAQHDQMSKRMTQAMLDIARVLTPEQRAKLAEHFKARADRMHERREGSKPGRAEAQNERAGRAP